MGHLDDGAPWGADSEQTVCLAPMVDSQHDDLQVFVAGAIPDVVVAA